MDTDGRRRGEKTKKEEIDSTGLGSNAAPTGDDTVPSVQIINTPPHVYRTHYVATALPTCLIHPAPRGHVSRGVMFFLKSAFLKALWFVLLKTAYITLRVRVACALMRSVAGAPLRARCLFTFSSWLPSQRSCLLFCLIHMGPPNRLQGCSQEGMRQERSVRMTSVYFPRGALA